MRGEPMLSVQGLVKRHGSLEAVGGVDFDVAPGEIFALIGPNGAGKTTILRIVGTILRATTGTAVVDGIGYLTLWCAGLIYAAGRIFSTDRILTMKLDLRRKRS